jgi:hypothetical protein
VVVNGLPSTELALAYEALRAQATGQLPESTPRGVALFLAAGCTAWMHAWRPVAEALHVRPAVPHQAAPSAALGGEVVQILTEMALGCQKRWTS